MAPQKTQRGSLVAPWNGAGNTMANCSVTQTKFVLGEEGQHLNNRGEKKASFEMTKKRRFVCVKSKSPTEPKQTQAEEKKVNLLNHNKPRKTLTLVFINKCIF